MGGGEWVNQRQQQQVQQVKKAYAEVQHSSSQHTSRELFSEIKMDGIDYAYAWARTFTPSWVMALIFVAGVITLAPKIFSKFGITLNLSMSRKKK